MDITDYITLNPVKYWMIEEIALTDSMKSVREECLGIDMNDYINDPISIQNLVNLL